MVNPGDITKFVSFGFFESYSAVGVWAMYISIAILILALGVLVWLFFSYKTKVVFFPMQGDPNNEETWVLGKPKKDRAKVYRKNGVEQLKLLFRRKSLKQVPYKYIYTDGLWLLRLSKDEFMPIKRPKFSTNPGVTLEAHDTDLEFWANVKYNELRHRFVDSDQQKRMIMWTGTILIVLAIVVTITIWLNVAYNNAALGKTGQIVEALQNLDQKIGLG